jgi:hypothetical protein
MALVLITPADLLDKANALGEAMGYGPGSYSVALSDNGKTVTHYGLSLERPGDDFLAMLQGAMHGNAPEGLDYPTEDFAAVLSALQMGEGAFADVAKAFNLEALPDEV